MGQQFYGSYRPNFNKDNNFYAPPNSSLAPIQAKQPDSRKKIFIIVGIVAAILILILTVVVSLKSKNVTEENWKNNASAETNSALNRFANWILFGEDSDEDFTKKEYGEEYDEYHVYFAEQKLYESDRAEYFEKALELSENLGELYSTDEGIEVATSPDYGASGSMLEFVITYFKTGVIGQNDENEVSKLYFEKGYDESMKYIESFYQPYKEVENIYAEDFAEEKIIHDTNIIKSINIQFTNGCIDVNLNESLTCQISEEDLNNIRAYESENTQLETSQGSMFINKLVMRIEQFCWIVGGSLYE